MSRAFREAVVALWRTGAVGAVSAVAVGASLLLVGLFVQIVDAAQSLGASVKDRVEVEVYLKDSVSRAKAQALARSVTGIAGVADVTYVDKETAAETFREMFGGELLDALSENPLPASLRVRFDPETDVVAAAREVTDTVAGDDRVESVDGGETWLTGLDRALEVSTGVAVVLGVVLCAACAFAVSNTSKLMVLAQRDAIEVMRLVGATNGFVRTTFLIGGALQGTIGGCMAAVGLALAAPWTAAWLDAGIPTLTVASGLIALGFVLGVVGSWTSLNRVLQAIAS